MIQSDQKIVAHFTTPYADHLQIRILDFHESAVEDWKDSDVNYQVIDVKGVPVIGFFFSHGNLNCMSHINFPDLLEWGSAEWLYREGRLKIALCLYDLERDLILDVKFILLTEYETSLIRSMCNSNRFWSKRLIDENIRFIYDMKFEEILG